MVRNKGSVMNRKSRAESPLSKKRRLSEEQFLAPRNDEANSPHSPFNLDPAKDRARRQRESTRASLRGTNLKELFDAATSSASDKRCCWVSPSTAVLSEYGLEVDDTLPIQFLTQQMRADCRTTISVETHEDTDSRVGVYDSVVYTCGTTIPSRGSTFRSSGEDCLFEAVLMAVGAKKGRKSRMALRLVCHNYMQSTPDLLDHQMDNADRDAVLLAARTRGRAVGITVLQALSDILGRPIYLHDSSMELWICVQPLSAASVEVHPAIYVVLANDHIHLLFKWDPRLTVIPFSRRQHPTTNEEGDDDEDDDDDAAPEPNASGVERDSLASSSSETEEVELDPAAQKALKFPHLHKIYSTVQADDRPFDTQTQRSLERYLGSSSLISTHPYDALRNRWSQLLPEVPAHLRDELSLLGNTLFTGISTIAVRVNMLVRQMDRYSAENRRHNRLLRKDLNTVAPVPAVCTKPKGPARYVRIPGQRRRDVTELARKYKPNPGIKFAELAKDLIRHLLRALIPAEELRFYTWSQYVHVKMVLIPTDMQEILFETIFDSMKIDPNNELHVGRDLSARRYADNSARSMFNEARDAFKKAHPNRSTAEIQEEIDQLKGRILTDQTEREQRHAARDV